jgi:choloylglycine hydrolase
MSKNKGYKKVLRLTVFLLLILVTKYELYGCTAFSLKQDNKAVVGCSYDWELDDGLIFVNKRGIKKEAIVISPDESPAQWVSVYGSVTFNQYGREIPIMGMNEAGLVLSSLWLDETQYPEPDGRKAVTNWMQYVLDTCGSIGGIQEKSKKVKIDKLMPASLQFFVCDENGQAAVFEFLEGKMVCITGDNMPVPVITNYTYNSRIKLYEKWKQGDSLKNVRDRRFIKAARSLEQKQVGKNKRIEEQAFSILDTVRQGNFTKWQIVFNQTKKQITYKTLRRPTEKTVRFEKLDFNPETPVKMISINTTKTGLLNPYFAEFDADVNHWLVRYSFSKTEFPNELEVPESLIEQIAACPEMIDKQN